MLDTVVSSVANSRGELWGGERCGEPSAEQYSVTSDGKSGGKDNNGSINNRGRRSRALVLVLLKIRFLNKASRDRTHGATRKGRGRVR